MDDYEKKTNGEGDRLLVELKTGVDEAMADAGGYGDSIDIDIDKAFAEGIATATVSDYKALKSRVSQLRRLLPATNPLSDSKFASRLATAAKNLGPFVKSEINNQMTLNKAAGDLVKTDQCIVTVLRQRLLFVRRCRNQP